MINPIAIENIRPRTPEGFPAKTVTGQRVTVSADIFRDGHDLLAAQVAWRPKGIEVVADGPIDPASQPPVGGDHHCVGHGAPRVHRPGLDRHLRHLAQGRPVETRRRPGHQRRAGGGRAVGRAGRRQGQGQGPPPIRAGRRDSPQQVPAGREPAGRNGGPRDPSHPAGDPGQAGPEHIAVDAPVGRPPPGAVQRLVRAVPPLERRVRGHHQTPGRPGGPGVRRDLPAAHPPDRCHRPQGQEQHHHAGAGRRRKPVGDRVRTGWPHRHRAEPRHLRGLRRNGRGGQLTGDGDLHRLRPPVLPGPPVGQRAPRVVPPPSRTGPSSSPRTPRRSTRTSTRSTSGPKRTRTGRLSGGRVGTSSSSGSSGASSSSGSTTRTPSRSPSGRG